MFSEVYVLISYIHEHIHELKNTETMKLCIHIFC